MILLGCLKMQKLPLILPCCHLTFQSKYRIVHCMLQVSSFQVFLNLLVFNNQKSKSPNNFKLRFKHKVKEHESFMNHEILVYAAQ